LADSDPRPCGSRGGRCGGRPSSAPSSLDPYGRCNAFIFAVAITRELNCAHLSDETKRSRARWKECALEPFLTILLAKSEVRSGEGLTRSPRYPCMTAMCALPPFSTCPGTDERPSGSMFALQGRNALTFLGLQRLTRISTRNILRHVAAPKLLQPIEIQGLLRCYAFEKGWRAEKTMCRSLRVGPLLPSDNCYFPDLQFEVCPRRTVKHIQMLGSHTRRPSENISGINEILKLLWLPKFVLFRSSR
jgi:hypothetical protein